MSALNEFKKQSDLDYAACAPFLETNVVEEKVCITDKPLEGS